MDVDVIGQPAGVPGPVRGHTDSFRRVAGGVFDDPALSRLTDLNHVPQVVALGFVVEMQVVDVEPTDVAQDLLGALVAPVVV